MTRDEVFQKVKSVIVDTVSVDADKVQTESDFLTDLGADSLDRVEVIIGLEEAFGLSIEETEAENIQTVGAAVDLVCSKLKIA